MQIEVERKPLVAGLKAALGAVDKRTTVPVLSTLLMRANGALELTGTDLDIDRRAVVPIVQGKGEGEYLIEDPRALLAVLSKADAERVAVTVQPGDAIAWRAGSLSASRKPDMHVDDFPTRHVQPCFAKAGVGADFVRAVRRLIGAVSTEETRYYLNGIAICKLPSGRWRLAATDGHQLRIHEIDLPDAAGAEWLGDAIIPRRAIAAMLDVIGKTGEGATMAFGRQAAANAEAPALPDPAAPVGRPTRVMFDGPGGSLVANLIDGTYPDVARVVPHVVQTGMRVETAALRRAVAQVRASILGSKSPAVRIAVTKTELIVSGASGTDIKVEVRVACDYAGAPFAVGFNADYLGQSLDVLGGAETMFAWDSVPPQFVDYSGCASAPCKMTDPADPDFMVVLMPMRV